jgi:hypothetical protein
VPEDTRGTMLQALLSMPGMNSIQFDGHAPPKLMPARELERVDGTPEAV